MPAVLNAGWKPALQKRGCLRAILKQGGILVMISL